MKSLELIPYIQHLRKQAHILHREPDTRLEYRITNMSDETMMLSVQKPNYRANGRIHVPTNTLNDAHAIARASFPRHAYDIIIPCPHPCNLVRNSFSLQSAHHTPTTIRAVQRTSFTERNIRFFHDPLLPNISPNTTFTEILHTMNKRFTQACAFIQDDPTINYQHTYINGTHQLHPSFPHLLLNIITLADYSNAKNINISLELQVNDEYYQRQWIPVNQTSIRSMEYIQPFIRRILTEVIEQQQPYNPNDSMHQQLQYLRMLQEYSEQAPPALINKMQQCFNIFERHYHIDTITN